MAHTCSPGVEDSPLQEAIPYIGELNLKYYQSSFTISFSTFNYLDGVSKYSYSLPPYDTEWSSPSNLNFATYRNLPPGKYELHVKACNAAGIWGEENVMEIIIAPPFWKTGWAYLIYAILIAIAGYFSFRIIRNFNALRNRIAVEIQLTEYKLEFFTNISHEFQHSADTDSRCFGENRQYGESFQRYATLPEDHGQEYEANVETYQSVVGIPENAEKQTRPLSGRNRCHCFLL